MTALTAMAASAGAITKNYQEDNVHDFVGLMVALDDQGEFLWRCSGSLLDATTFLTAGHCTDAPAVGARVYFQQDAGANYDPATQSDPVSGYPDECLDPTMCHESSSIFDYGFDDFAGFPNTGNITVPNTADPDDLIAPFWDVLVPAPGTGGVLYRTDGAAPNRIFTVEWRDMMIVSGAVACFDNGSRLNFQARLFEADGSIRLPD